MTKKKRGRKNKPTRGRRQRRLEKRRASQRRIILIGVLAAGLLLIAAFSFWPTTSTITVSEARLEDDPARGPAGAAVTIVEYADFGCPACQAWHRTGVLDLIQETYGDRVRIVWRDLPIITSQSPKAAEAGQCAHDQGLFWEYHDLLFARSPRLSLRELKQYAVELGLDTVQFNECLDSGQHRETVDRDMREAFGLGLRGTPSFVVNGQALVAPTPQRVIEIIESALASH